MQISPRRTQGLLVHSSSLIVRLQCFKWLVRIYLSHTEIQTKLKLQAALNGPSHSTQLGELATRAAGSHSPHDTRGATIVASWPDWSQSSLCSNTASLLQAEAVRVSLQDTFLCVLGGYTCLLIFEHIGEMSYGGYFEERVWLSHLATLNNEIHTICSGLDCQ